MLYNMAPGHEKEEGMIRSAPGGVPWAWEAIKKHSQGTGRHLLPCIHHRDPGITGPDCWSRVGVATLLEAAALEDGAEQPGRIWRMERSNLGGSGGPQACPQIMPEGSPPTG
ncbi:hypothetical protein NDU88_006543 [Pleurodeles waltl]|uniref:Uncharacterized protein n=1 Tax=Pleurodeles waltl TaxID=8319 RepID=A0AAV7PMQ8_PLEWA|nr:hypothetical protein NDU88_006543 [Pleurodeles waltl]